jgi:hypothetical protein
MWPRASRPSPRYSGKGRIADHEIGVVRSDAVLGLRDRVEPFVGLEIAAAYEDQRQQIDLFLDIEPSDEFDDLEAAASSSSPMPSGSSIVTSLLSSPVVVWSPVVGGTLPATSRAASIKAQTFSVLMRSSGMGPPVFPEERQAGPGDPFAISCCGFQSWAISRAMIRRWMSLVPS